MGASPHLLTEWIVHKILSTNCEIEAILFILQWESSKIDAEYVPNNEHQFRASCPQQVTLSSLTRIHY